MPHFLGDQSLANLASLLRTREAAPIPLTPDSAPDAYEMTQAFARYMPLCEAMVLMMHADGPPTPDERDGIRALLRGIASGALKPAHADAMIDSASRAVADAGRVTRLRELVRTLWADQVRSEAAFVLAAAVAMIDGRIADEENDLLNELAGGLGIDATRANELLDAAQGR